MAWCRPFSATSWSMSVTSSSKTVLRGCQGLSLMVVMSTISTRSPSGSGTAPRKSSCSMPSSMARSSHFCQWSSPFEMILDVLEGDRPTSSAMLMLVVPNRAHLAHTQVASCVAHYLLVAPRFAALPL